MENKSRELVIANMLAYAKDLAEALGCDQVKEREDRQKGIWGERMTEVIEKEHGQCTKEITYYHGEGMERTVVQFRFRFANPIVSLSTNGGLVFASVEVGEQYYRMPDGELPKDENGRKLFLGDGYFRPNEFQCWGLGSIEHLQNMVKCIEERTNKMELGFYGPTPKEVEDIWKQASK